MRARRISPCGYKQTPWALLPNVWIWLSSGHWRGSFKPTVRMCQHPMLQAVVAILRVTLGALEAGKGVGYPSKSKCHVNLAWNFATSPMSCIWERFKLSRS